MAGFGTFGHGLSSTLSPLAPPFTAYQSALKFDSTSQDTGPTGDLGHYSNCGSSDKWLHIHPPSVEKNYLSSSPDTNFLSSGHNPAFPYAQESVCVSSFPVAEAEPFYPKYPLPVNRSFEASIPYSLCGRASSSAQTGPWIETFVEGKVEPSGSYASSWKEFKGKVPNYQSSVTQGFNMFKGNLGVWESHYTDALARKDNMGLEGISMDHVDEYSLHSAEENSGFFSYCTSRSCDLQSSCLPQKSFCSHLPIPLVPTTEWCPRTPVKSPSSTVSPLGDALKVESTIPESDAFLSQHLTQPACYGTNALEMEASNFSWNMQKDAAFPCSKQRESDVEKSSCQIGIGESREILEEISGPKDVSFCSFNRTSNNHSNSQNINLHQSNIFSFSSGPGMPLRSSSDITDPLNHGVDSPCWKGASPSQSLFAASIQISEHSAVGLEVTDSPKVRGSTSKEETDDLEVRCTSPSRDPFSVWVTSQLKPVVSGQAEAIGSDKSASGSDQAGSDSAKTNRCIGPSGQLKDSTICHALSETAKSGFILETACLISNVEREVGAIRVPCSRTHECNQSESGNISPLKLKGETIVETICNLCNLLISSQFCDLNMLKDEDCKNLQSAMNILSIQLSAGKKDDELGFTDGFKKPVDPFQQVDMSNKSENLRRNLKTSSHQHDNHSFSSNFYKFDEFSTDETDCKTSIGTTQVLETHLRENVFCPEEVHPQALIYKNLWIEAEAALCTMKYKLQCAQMQMKIHKLKDRPVKDGEESVGMYESPLAEKVPVLNPLDTGHMANLNEREKRRKDIASDDCPLKNLSNTDNKSQADISPDNSVMARFRILKNRNDDTNKIHLQNCLVSDNVRPIKTGLQSDCEKMDNFEIRDSTTKMINSKFFEDRRHRSYVSESSKNVNLGVEEVSTPLESMQTIYPNLSATSVFHKPSKTKSGGTREPEYSALDWEHVLEDEFVPSK